ncbi:hypothetical protein [Crenobacter cavernae]
MKNWSFSAITSSSPNSRSVGVSPSSFASPLVRVSFMVVPS